MAVQADIATEYSMGRQGFQLVTDTAVKTGNWSSLVPIEPTVFSSITGTNISGTWLSKTIPTGQVLPGDITGFQINSGAVIAFLARTP